MIKCLTTLYRALGGICYISRGTRFVARKAISCSDVSREKVKNKIGQERSIGLRHHLNNSSLNMPPSKLNSGDGLPALIVSEMILRVPPPQFSNNPMR